jgi:hypothetical protein
MDVVNIRYGKEATTPEATDGWYKVGLMTLGTQLRAVPGMIRNASGPSVVPILRCVFLQHSGQEHISNEDAAVNQPHSLGLRQELLGALYSWPSTLRLQSVGSLRGTATAIGQQTPSRLANGRVHTDDDLVIPRRATGASQPYNS